MATWDDASSGLLDLVFNYANAKIASEVRPPAPAPAPMPYYPGTSNVIPFPARDAYGNDIGQQVGEIFSSPRTWLLLGAAVVLVVVLVKIRR